MSDATSGMTVVTRSHTRCDGFNYLQVRRLPLVWNAPRDSQLTHWNDGGGDSELLMINVAIVREPCDNHRCARAYIEAGTGHHKHTACFEQHCIVCIEWSWEKTCHSVKDGWEISSPPLATHRTSLATPLTLRHYAPLPSYANCPLFSTVCRAFKLKEVFSHPNWRWPVIFYDI